MIRGNWQENFLTRCKLGEVTVSAFVLVHIDYRGSFLVLRTLTDGDLALIYQAVGCKRWHLSKNDSFGQWRSTMKHGYGHGYMDTTFFHKVGQRYVGDTLYIIFLKYFLDHHIIKI